MLLLLLFGGLRSRPLTCWTTGVNANINPLAWWSSSLKVYIFRRKKALKRVHLEKKKKGGQKVLMMGGGTAPAVPTKSRTCHKFYGILKTKNHFAVRLKKKEESLRGISLYLVWMLRARWKDFAAGLHANEAFLTGHTDTVCCTQRIFKKTTTNQSALSMCTRFIKKGHLLDCLVSFFFS